jgi:hypothetical protein
MAKRRHMSALQRKYFGKGHRVHSMRKRVSAVRVYHKRRGVMARYRKHYSRGGRGFGGMKSMLAPVLGGVADSYLDPMIPGFNGIGSTGIGFIMKNETLKNLGLYKLGYSLGGMIPLPGRTGGSNGGSFT